MDCLFGEELGLNLSEKQNIEVLLSLIYQESYVYKVYIQSLHIYRAINQSITCFFLHYYFYFVDILIMQSINNSLN